MTHRNQQTRFTMPDRRQFLYNLGTGIGSVALTATITDTLPPNFTYLPGSANPGERGNMYLAAHNDIYGEIFRYLEDLEVGDEYSIFAGGEEFKYVIKEKRIIEPTEVEVMLPTTEPISTLQTCYPYLVDTHRLVVIGELAE